VPRLWQQDPRPRVSKTSGRARGRFRLLTPAVITPKTIDRPRVRPLVTIRILRGSHRQVKCHLPGGHGHYASNAGLPDIGSFTQRRIRILSYMRIKQRRKCKILELQDGRIAVPPHRKRGADKGKEDHGRAVSAKVLHFSPYQDCLTMLSQYIVIVARELVRSGPSALKKTSSRHPTRRSAIVDPRLSRPPNDNSRSRPTTTAAYANRRPAS
jgi:hypothetical protein